MLHRHYVAFVTPNHFIDNLWCDIERVYLRGWIHCLDAPITRHYIRCGDAVAEITDRISRPDVAALYPGIPSDLCGYSVYLPYSPFRPICIRVSTPQESLEWEIDIAPFPHLRDADIVAPLDLLADFSTEMKARGGRVVEIGARTVTPA